MKYKGNWKYFPILLILDFHFLNLEFENDKAALTSFRFVLQVRKPEKEARKISE